MSNNTSNESDKTNTVIHTAKPSTLLTLPKGITKSTLYYDSDCPLCSAEMDKLYQLKNDTLQLIPINKIADTHTDMTQTDINKLYDELHIRTEDGSWLTGYDANIYAWQQTKYIKFAKVLGKPPFLWFGKLGYKTWLVWYHLKRK